MKSIFFSSLQRKTSTTLVIILPSIASRTGALWEAVPFIVGAKPARTLAINVRLAFG